MARKEFSLPFMSQHFQSAIADLEDDVEVLAYCHAYDEICNLLLQMGRIFGFVEHDVLGKITNIRKGCQELLSRRPELEGGLTVRALTELEVAKNGVPANKKDRVNHAHWPFTVDLIRLHRALDFVIRLIDAMYSASDNDSVASLARAAYDASLSPYHPFLVRKACNLSFYALPSKIQCAKILLGDLTLAEGERIVKDALGYSRQAEGEVTGSGRENVVKIEAFARMEALLILNDRLPYISQS